jgi:hypothetical protein
MVHTVFQWCVSVLTQLAHTLGMSYEALNILVFCTAWPLLTVMLVGGLVGQRRLIHRLQRELRDE